MSDVGRGGVWRRRALIGGDGPAFGTRRNQSRVAERPVARQPFFMQPDKKPDDGVSPKKEPKPWPMFWIVIAILVYAVIQTAVMAFG